MMIKRFTFVAWLLLSLSLAACDPGAATSIVGPTATPIQLQGTADRLTQPASETPTPTDPSPTQTPTPAVSPTLKPTAKPRPIRVGPDQYPRNVNPLTGLTVADTSRLNRRPLAVKVTIIPRYARPQWGLSLADIVYEFYQNGGISRFHAIFYGNDAERVGPIRSARLFDRKLMVMYKSIFAFGGADPTILGILNSAPIAPYLVPEYPAGCGPMCRIDQNTFNHLVTNTEDLSQYVIDRKLNNRRQDLTGMFFDSQTPRKGENAKVVYVRYSPQVYNRWDFDPVTGRYVRYQDSANDIDGAGEAYLALTDRLTGGPIVADNVVVLQMAHEFFRSPPNEIVNIVVDSLTPSGPAFAFRDGKVFAVRWSVPRETSVLSLTYEDGEPFPFKPGTTWFQVVGQSSTPSEPEITARRFQFTIP